MDAILVPGDWPHVDPVIGHAAAAALGILLILGAWNKLREPEMFRDAVGNYRIVSDGSAAFTARTLPIVEGLAGLAIVPTATRAAGALLALAVLAVVTGAVAINVHRGRTRIDCGCGGDQHMPLGAGLVARNIVLMVVAVLALLAPTNRDPVWIDFPAIAFGVLSALALYTVTNSLLRNHARLADLRNAP